MRFAIPTFRRTGILREKTLGYLERVGVQPDEVSIFVADDAELASYRDALDPAYADRLFVTAPGLTASRRVARERHLTVGEEVIWMDDDVAGLVRRLNDKEVEDVDDIHALAAEGFAAARSCGAHLWGVYPTVNPFFMKPRVRTDLRHIVGSFFGVIVRDDPDLDACLGDAKEDYERSLRFYDRDRVLCRIEYVAPRTTYYRRDTGGITDRTPASVEANVRALEQRWPGRIKRRSGRKSGYPEILLVS